jgi:hypothetical protein
VLRLRIRLPHATGVARLGNVDPEEDEFDFEEEDWDQYIPMKILMWL